ncbi:MAG TPA: alpha/beta hydrolase family protein [Vicinamibacteria bacterium]|nr:alpha/beta hydrolase family protein [Vicinamibacteria bacterium]
MSTRREFLQGSLWGTAAALAGPPGAEAVSPAGVGSHIGSLFPFVESQAVAGELPLSFLRPEFDDLAAWKRQARGRLLELLHYAPDRTDLRAETVERVDRGGYVQEKVYFNTTPDIRVPACVLLPKNARGRAPALVALHDHGGFYLWGKEKLVESDGEHAVLTKFKQQYYGGRSIASELARAGYVVVVIDMFYWGERRMLLADDPPDWRERPPALTAERIAAFNRRASENEQLLARTIYAAGFTWAGVMYWDDIRTVDYLASRPEVDPARIGCLGLSMGGLRTIHLAALDDRIKAAVAVGWMTSFPPQLERHVRNTIGFTKLVPGLYRHLDYPDVASLAAPTPLLVINGSQDALFAPAGVQASFEKLAACYLKAGAPDNVKTRLYDAPHEFNLEMQAEAWAWLAKHLAMK